MMFPTTPLRADTVQATISRPTAIAVMASNGFNRHGSTPSTITTIKQDTTITPAPAKTSATSAVASNSHSTSGSVNTTTSASTNVPTNPDTVVGTILAHLTNMIGQPTETMYRTAHDLAMKMGLSMAAIGKRGFKCAKSALLALLALVLRRKTPKVAKSNDRDALRTTVCHYEALTDVDDDAATPDVPQGIAVLETAAPESVTDETVAIQEIVGEIIEELVQEVDQEVSQEAVLGETVQETAVKETTVQDSTIEDNTSITKQNAAVESDVIDSTSIDDIDAITQEPTVTSNAATNTPTETSSIHSESEPAASESSLRANQITPPTCTGFVPFGSCNLSAATEFTFSAPGPVMNKSPMTDTNSHHTIPSFATDSMFGRNKLDAADFTFTAAAAAKESSAATCAARQLPIVVPSSEFNFTGPSVERKTTKRAGSEESDNWSAGSFSPLFNISSEPKRSSSIAEIKVAEKIKALEEEQKLEDEKKLLKEEEKKIEETRKIVEEKKTMIEEKRREEEKKKREEENKKSGTKHGKNNKPKKPTNKAAVWGGKKGKKGKKH